jgi:hypothetical protein
MGGAIMADYQHLALIQLNKWYCAAERCDQCEIGKKIFKEYPRNLLDYGDIY